MRRAALVGVLLAAVALAACGPRSDTRTGHATLDRAMSRAFKRNYAAAFRMRTGEANRFVVRHADVRCTPLEAQPDDDARPWRWRCRVRWYLRGRPEAGLATYGVGVRERGCFEARSGAFPPRLPERILGGRLATNPLLYIRSCP